MAVAISSRLGPVTRQHVPPKRGTPSRYASQAVAFLMMLFMSATVTPRCRCRSLAWSTTQYRPFPSASLAQLSACAEVDGPDTDVTCCYIRMRPARSEGKLVSPPPHNDDQRRPGVGHAGRSERGRGGDARNDDRA